MMLAKQHHEFNSIQRSTGFAELDGGMLSKVIFRAFYYGQMTVKLTYPGRDTTQKNILHFSKNVWLY